MAVKRLREGDAGHLRDWAYYKRALKFGLGWEPRAPACGGSSTRGRSRLRLRAKSGSLRRLVERT